MELLHLQTPFGQLSSWTVDAPGPDAQPLGGSSLHWVNDDLDVTVTGAPPSYDDVQFDVDGHFAWLWRITVLRDRPQLRIVTRLTPDEAFHRLRAAPVHEPWVLGVRWDRDGIVGAIGTSDLDALSIRGADGRLFPERYLDDVDPSRPGHVPFIERTDMGIVATFASPRAGEAFSHHTAVAWAPSPRAQHVMNAVEVESDGILRGAIATT